jgi:hypothetical protein
MSESSEIVLSLSVAGMEQYCQDVLRQARNTGHALTQLAALQSLIASHTQPGATQSPAYQAIMALVELHAAEARRRLLQESTAALVPALSRRQLCSVVQVHVSLSRNGFHQAAIAAIARLTAAERHAAQSWAALWCADATRRAEAASGYPGALNLEAAGISATDYAAMRDVSLYLADALV